MPEAVSRSVTCLVSIDCTPSTRFSPFYYPTLALFQPTSLLIPFGSHQCSSPLRLPGTPALTRQAPVPDSRHPSTPLGTCHVTPAHKPCQLRRPGRTLVYPRIRKSSWSDHGLTAIPTFSTPKDVGFHYHVATLLTLFIHVVSFVIRLSLMLCIDGTEAKEEDKAYSATLARHNQKPTTTATGVGPAGAGNTARIRGAQDTSRATPTR